MVGSNLTISDMCELLGVSRQMVHNYRKKYQLRTRRVGRFVLFDAIEVLEKLYLPKREYPHREVALTAYDSFRVEDLEVVSGVFDLRMIRGVDPFGVMCLLCRLVGRMSRGESIILLIGRDSTTIRLKGMNFFHELKRFESRRVHFDEALLDGMTADTAEIIMPLHVIGYRGGEKTIMDELSVRLKHQGFSTELCASLGWILGELADNTAVHAGGVPCYFLLSSRFGHGPSKYLTLTMGDIGHGVPVTLKTNNKYAQLEDFNAFVHAFKSNVSSWSDEHRRGRGLNDLLGVAKGNKSWVRAESNEVGLMFDFQHTGPVINRITTGTSTSGTRYCLVLIDSTFDFVSREEVDHLINQYLELQ